MILLSYQNGSILTFEQDVWSTLRKQHRIVGTLIGCLPKLPRQNIFHGLPMTLMPEQALLLAEKKIVRIIEWSKLNIEPDAECIELFNKELQQQQNIQNESFKLKRKLEIEQNLDKIILAKQKKQLSEHLNREEILENEINKIPTITKDNLLTPLQIDVPTYMKGDPIDVPLEKIKEKLHPIRYKIFTDLWERGYYVTDGLNFGGDFLVYNGDPSIYHASFIVKCINCINYQFKVPEIIALGRLGNSVKKKFVFASEENSKIQYLTLTWNNFE